MNLHGFAFCLASVWLLFTAPGLAPSKSAAIQTAAQAVARTAEQVADERWGEAILALEEAADEGLVHPDLSFNRGLAYLGRARTPQVAPGDLGQAAAGFAEALLLRPGEPEAERGLETAQLLIARDRTQSASSPESSSLGLIERILLAIPPLLLVLLGGFSSLLCCVGLALRTSANETRKVTGGILALIGAFLLLPSFASATARAALFRDARVAVVIADRAELLNSAGGRLSHQLPYRQGTVVHLGEPSAGLAPTISFGRQAHISLARVRLLQGSPQ